MQPDKGIPLDRFLLMPLDITTPHELPFPTYQERVDKTFVSSAKPSTACQKSPLVHFTSSFFERTREVMLEFGKDAMEVRSQRSRDASQGCSVNRRISFTIPVLYGVLHLSHPRPCHSAGLPRMKGHCMDGIQSSVSSTLKGLFLFIKFSPQSRCLIRRFRKEPASSREGCALWIVALMKALTP